MTKEEITEGNKLIALYMNFKGYTSWKPNDLKYHTDWNMLMKVVEKVYLSTAVKDVCIHPGKTRIWFANDIKEGFINSPCKPENSSIIECWLAIIEFIKWKNEQK